MIEVSFAEVKHQLTQQKHKHVEKEGTITNLNDTSSRTFVIAALELQEAQKAVT